MKKVFLTVLLIALLLPFSIRSQELVESPTQGFLMLSGWNDDNFGGKFGAGMRVGLQVPLDLGRGLWLRATYAQYNLTGVDWELDPGEDPEANAHALGFSVLMDWHLGKLWKFYVPVGADAYVAGPIEGTDMFTGFGASRRIWTDATSGYLIPAHLDAFAELTLADGNDGSAGNYIEINLGIRFGRSVKSR